MLLEFYGSFKGNRRFYAGFFLFLLLDFVCYACIYHITDISVLIPARHFRVLLLLHSIFQPYDVMLASANILDAYSAVDIDLLTTNLCVVLLHLVDKENLA